MDFTADSLDFVDKMLERVDFFCAFVVVFAVNKYSFEHVKHVSAKRLVNDVRVNIDFVSADQQSREFLL